MAKDDVEPGLMSIFGLYIVVRMGVIFSSALLYFIWYGFSLQSELTPYVILFVVDILFLFIFLGWPWLQRRLGRIYLPIALTVASAIPITEGRYLVDLYGAESGARMWLVFPFLSVPLILIAWQYHFRHVVIYCLSTGMFELAIIILFQKTSMMQIISDLEIILARSVFFILMGYIVSNLVEEQRRQRRELAEANRQLVRYASTLEQLTISRERNRLARELHDTLAHTLSGLAVQLDAIATVWEQIPPRAAVMLDRALETTRHGLDETRRALQSLRAKPLEDLGLGLAIRGLAEDAAARNSLALSLNTPEALRSLPPEIEQSFYRVAQEALENVAKHANASRVAVSLEQRGNTLVLTVADDGLGFAPQALEADDRFGLQGMRERAELIGGQLEVSSLPERGTTVRLSAEVIET